MGILGFQPALGLVASVSLGFSIINLLYYDNCKKCAIIISSDVRGGTLYLRRDEALLHTLKTCISLICCPPTLEINRDVLWTDGHRSTAPTCRFLPTFVSLLLLFLTPKEIMKDVKVAFKTLRQNEEPIAVISSLLKVS